MRGKFSVALSVLVVVCAIGFLVDCPTRAAVVLDGTPLTVQSYVDGGSFESRDATISDTTAEITQPVNGFSWMVAGDSVDIVPVAAGKYEAQLNLAGTHTFTQQDTLQMKYVIDPAYTITTAAITKAITVDDLSASFADNVLTLNVLSPWKVSYDQDNPPSPSLNGEAAVTFLVAEVPEPGMGLIAAVVLTGLGLRRRKRAFAC